MANEAQTNMDSLEKGVRLGTRLQHLAERVCVNPRDQLAIAHGVENEFWEEVEVSGSRGGKNSGESKNTWQPRNLNENQMSELIRQKMAEVK